MLTSVINALLKRTLLGAYPGTVRATKPDGSLDVEFDDLALRGRGIPGVRVGYGIAETAADVQDGTRVLVEFAEGDPSQPVVAAFSYSADKATVKIGTDPRAVARDGDVVRGVIDSTTVLAGMIGPPSPKVAAVIAAGSGSVLTLPPLTPIALTGASVEFEGRITVPRTKVCA